MLEIVYESLLMCHAIDKAVGIVWLQALCPSSVRYQTQIYDDVIVMDICICPFLFPQTVCPH